MNFATIRKQLRILLSTFLFDIRTEDWQTPVFQNGWSTYGGAGYADTQFCKDAIGFVHIKGLMLPGTKTAGTTIFTLPIGYRPSTRILFPILMTDLLGGVDIYPTGEVVIRPGVAWTSWANIDGITFRAEN